MQITDKWPIVSIRKVSKFFGEFQALKDELTRISNATEYNGMGLFFGGFCF